MNKLLAIAGSVVFLSVPCGAAAGTLFTTPVIFVQPATLYFGPVAGKASLTNSFVVENMGRGTLVGTATVPPPFKILSGGNYTLRENEAQVVTVTYTPSGTSTNTQTVRFTGGGAAKATVIGAPAAAPWYELKRK